MMTRWKRQNNQYNHFESILLIFTHIEYTPPIHCKLTKPPVYPQQGVLCLTMSRTCTGKEHCVLCACVWMLYVLTQFLHICIHE